MDYTMKLKPMILIFSTYRTERSNDANMQRHYSTMQLLESQGIPHKEVIGSYKGTKERSILVVGDFEKQVKHLASEHNQESYLVATKDSRDAFLVFLADNSETYLGVFTETTKEVAEMNDSYTFDPSNDGYWITINKVALGRNVK